MKKKVVIRCDGGPKIGLGHLIRSIALANMLKDNFDIAFINKEIPETVRQELLGFGFSQSFIKEEKEIFSKISKDDIVVLDHYGLTSEFQLEIKQNGHSLVCIDDLHEKKFYADLIINHAPDANTNWYHAEAYTKYALGLSYALLRPAFLKEAKQERKIKNIENLLICFGGADMYNLSLISLESAVKSSLYNEIHVIIGASYLTKPLLEDFIKHRDNIYLYENINEEEIIKIMKKTDLAVVPSSGILFETIACGCEAISGYYVDNQQEIYEGFKNLDLIHPAEDFSDIDSILANSKNFNIKNNKRRIDGLSGERLLKYFQEL